MYLGERGRPPLVVPMEASLRGRLEGASCQVQKDPGFERQGQWADSGGPNLHSEGQETIPVGL